MSKHAYLIVANSNLSVVRTALRLIDDIRNDIYLLIDKKSRFTEDTLKLISSDVRMSNLFITNCFTVNWGGYSQIEATLKLLEMAISSGEMYEYFHFFQGSDLPIKTQDEIHSFFKNVSGQEFINIDKGRCKMAQNKCWYYHLFCHNRFYRKNKLMKALNFFFVYIQKILHIKHNVDIELYQGSALFSITRKFAVYLLSKKEEIEKRFRYSLAADECFIQSMVMCSPFKDSIRDIDKQNSSNARLIDRTRPDGKNSPHVWRKEELNYLLKQPVDICFARKFDEGVDKEIVEMIEAKLKINRSHYGKEI